ncbi:LysR family transcriptional regulator [Fluviibacterium sp. S390]|uniref:LysR family transcriptional regulator n=1 Tax=Fluviibacterium sp. S390 TaxID=3415139 RepID=UPI003C79FB3E
MNWKDIPSLSALRAFEATARHGSFSAAARELNVTHAAIAQHVRALEADFRTQLVVRQGQGMALTSPGEHLARDLFEAFGTVASAVTRLRQAEDDRPVHVTLTPSFAESWLMPRLGGFWSAYPEIDLILHPSTQVSDLRRDEIDLAIRFGHGNWPGLVISRLLESPFVVVASPAYAQGAQTLADLGDPRQHSWFFPSVARELQVWGLALGLDFEKIPYRDLQSTTLVHAAVREGYGLSIQAQSLVEREIENGSLVALEQGDAAGLGYYLVTRNGPVPPKVQQVMAWLRRQAKGV